VNGGGERRSFAGLDGFHLAGGKVVFTDEDDYGLEEEGDGGGDGGGGGGGGKPWEAGGKKGKWKSKRVVTGNSEGFKDMRRILVRAGRGGNGCVSFFHEPYARNKIPDGSDGGLGGRVVLVADNRLSSLGSMAVTHAAPNGANGAGKTQTGAKAKDLAVRVPTGTLVKEDGKVLVDLTQHNSFYIAAFGGVGGRGNTGGTPATRSDEFGDERMKGEEGEELRLELELKTIADVGLVGMPNAGKSTFVSAVYGARFSAKIYTRGCHWSHVCSLQFLSEVHFSYQFTL
jgi:hypothetical protein